MNRCVWCVCVCVHFTFLDEWICDGLKIFHESWPDPLPEHFSPLSSWSVRKQRLFGCFIFLYFFFFLKRSVEFQPYKNQCYRHTVPPPLIRPFNCSSSFVCSDKTLNELFSDLVFFSLCKEFHWILWRVMLQSADCVLTDDCSTVWVLFVWLYSIFAH